eukprot:GHVS01089012.1.p1 GENE.GHVS01089012.1~~GHVS01089012.1.p1  ORF type:complete len:223 (+),score=9.10 GHVS01089012.1:329-997(+)
MLVSLALTHASMVVLIGLAFGIVFGFTEFGGVGFDAKEKPGAVFSWHPLLNIIAYGVLMSEGLIAFRAWGWARPNRNAAHAVLHGLVSFLAILSLTAVLVFHDAIKAPNFYSVHSWVGLLVYILTWTQFLGGFFVFGIPNLVSPALRAAMLPVHKVSGLFVYVAALIALVTGLLQKQSFIRGGLSVYAPVVIFSNVLSLWIIATAALVLWHVTSEQPKHHSV